MPKFPRTALRERGEGSHLRPDWSWNCSSRSNCENTVPQDGLGVRLYLVGEVAQILRLSPSQVYTLIGIGKLRCHRLTSGRQGGIRVSEEQLTAFLRQTEQRPEEPPAPPAPPADPALPTRQPRAASPSGFVFLPPKT